MYLGLPLRAFARRLVARVDGGTDGASGAFGGVNPGGGLPPDLGGSPKVLPLTGMQFIGLSFMYGGADAALVGTGGVGKVGNPGGGPGGGGGCP